MNRSRTGLALMAAGWLVSTAAGAPAPVRMPPSRGPITEALRLRDQLPRTNPPLVSLAVITGKGIIEMEVRRSAVVYEEYAQNVMTPGGRVVTVRRMRTRAVPIATTMHVQPKACKFFEVTKEGKLEPIEPAKATARLKKRTAVLTGQCAKVDPRHLAVIRPGTLYLVLPPPTAPPAVSDEKRRPVPAPR